MSVNAEAFKNMHKREMAPGAYGKILVVPQDPVDKEFLESVDAKSTSESKSFYSLLIDYQWIANTVTSAVIRTLISKLGAEFNSHPNKLICFQFYDMLKIFASNKVNEKAEKEGNINVYFEPGDGINNLLEFGPPQIPENPYPLDHDFITGIEDDDKVYHDIAVIANYELSRNHGIAFSNNPLTSFAIAYLFIKNIYVELIYRLVNDTVTPEGESRLVSVNFNNLIEFHATMDVDKKIEIHLRPGYDAKLIIKNDEVTEHTLIDS